MRDIAYIEDAYLVADGELAARERSAGSVSERTDWQLKRMINDSAYFLLAFAQFEDAAKARVAQISARRRQAPSWDNRTPWDVLDTERLSLMDVVALLFQKGMSDYNEIGRYKDDRDLIAHGDWPSQSIFVPRLIQRLGQLEAQFPI